MYDDGLKEDPMVASIAIAIAIAIAAVVGTSRVENIVNSYRRRRDIIRMKKDVPRSKNVQRGDTQEQ